MSWPTQKGYIRARVIAETAPDDQAAVWAVGADENSITDYRWCISGTWTSYKTLFSAYVESVTTPGAADRNKIWVKVDGSGNIIEFHRYIYGSTNAWKSFTELYSGMVTAETTAGADQTKLLRHVDGSGNSLGIKFWNGDAWQRLDALNIQKLESGRLFTDADTGKVLTVPSGAELRIPTDDLSDGFHCTVLLQDPAGQFTVTANSTITLDHLLENTLDVTKACFLMKIAAKKYFIIGNLV